MINKAFIKLSLLVYRSIQLFVDHIGCSTVQLVMALLIPSVWRVPPHMRRTQILPELTAANAVNNEI